MNENDSQKIKNTANTENTATVKEKSNKNQLKETKEKSPSLQERTVALIRKNCHLFYDQAKLDLLLQIKMVLKFIKLGQQILTAGL